MGKYIICGYILIIILHLFFCFQVRETPRKITKLMLMPILLLIYVLYAKEIQVTILIALTFGFIGDLFLIFIENKKCFMLGLGSFLIGHVFYIITIVLNTEWVLIPLLIAAAVSVTLLVFAVITLVQKIQKDMRIPSLVYSFTLVMLLFFCLNRFVSFPDFKNMMLLGGAVLFCLSDYILAHSVYLKKIPRDDFYIMITYIAAQTLITAAFI